MSESERGAAGGEAGRPAGWSGEPGPAEGGRFAARLIVVAAAATLGGGLFVRGLETALESGGASAPPAAVDPGQARRAELLAIVEEIRRGVDRADAAREADDLKQAKAEMAAVERLVRRAQQQRPDILEIRKSGRWTLGSWIDWQRHAIAGAERRSLAGGRGR